MGTGKTQRELARARGRKEAIKRVGGAAATAAVCCALEGEEKRPTAPTTLRRARAHGKNATGDRNEISLGRVARAIYIYICTRIQPITPNIP